MYLPDRWLDYTPVGGIIKGTRFIAFKVPLKQSACQNMKEEERFTIPLLHEMLKSQSVKLGLVIDLTNTTKYYFPQDFQNIGVKYVKIFTEGHLVPSDAVYLKFFEAIEQFLKENKRNDTVIGVHCTHGVNRTGHLICRYMIERMHMEPRVALNAFKTARGHAIERPLYIEDLILRKPVNSALQFKQTQGEVIPSIADIRQPVPIKKGNSRPSPQLKSDRREFVHRRHPATSSHRFTPFERPATQSQNHHYYRNSGFQPKQNLYHYQHGFAANQHYSHFHQQSRHGGRSHGFNDPAFSNSSAYQQLNRGHSSYDPSNSYI